MTLAEDTTLLVSVVQEYIVKTDLKHRSDGGDRYGLIGNTYKSEIYSLNVLGRQGL